LNVFKSDVKTRKGEETRALVFETAMRLFRDKGFEATTMRDVAAEARLSLGAAYHYFPSKESIVLAYYDQVQDAHAERVRAILGEAASSGSSSAAAPPLRDRLAAAMHGKLDILRDDRPLMGALLRYTGVPEHPLSFLGEATRDLQLRSIAVFADALAGERLPKDVEALVPVALWALHMGLLLYFLYDTSDGHTRTRRLTDGAVDLFVKSLSLIKLPIVRPMRRRVVALLEEAGLVPTAESLAKFRAHATATTEEETA
jgi:AcrR family transcriptional regulator